MRTEGDGMKNGQIASILLKLADLLELSGENSFKVQAYRKAARMVESLRTPVGEMKGRLTEIQGIGKGTASVIEEILETGTTELLEDLLKKLPPELPDLLLLPGLGPRSVQILYRELQVTNLQELKQAAEQQKIRSLPGFGPKKEQKVLAAIEQFQNRPDRHLLHEALHVAVRMRDWLAEDQRVLRVELAGSIRRMKETIKDVDLVAATHHPVQVGERIVSCPDVVEVINQGETKVTVRVDADGIVLPVDVRLVKPEQFASSLHHFTGSKEHNVRIRQRAKQMGMRVNEYGVLEEETGKVVTYEDEAGFFAYLNLPYIPPELREDRGEIEAADAGTLPSLITRQNIRGDLHMHSRYSDGSHDILEMALKAKELGYEYIAITDHSQSLRIAGGLTVQQLEEQWEEIERVNREVEGITVLKGIEMDILPDGSLDYPDEVLREFDLVIASIHSRFGQDEKTMTRRIIRAMENPHVHMIAHPTGRLLLRRDPYAVALDLVFKTAAETGTVLELNSNPHRLDLNDQWLKRAKDDYGVSFAINTDAHSREGLHNLTFGLATARRGWLTKDDVINTLPLQDLLRRLKKK